MSTNYNARIFYTLKDTVSAPSLDSFTHLSSFPFPPGMNGNPIAGSVYRFIPHASNGTVGYTSIQTIESHQLLYEVDRSDLRIDIFNSDVFQYSILNLAGQLLYKGHVSKGRTYIPLQSLSNGLYMVRLESDSENSILKFAR